MCRTVQHRCQNWNECQNVFSEGYAGVCDSQNNGTLHQMRGDRPPGFCGYGVDKSWYTDYSYCDLCKAQRAIDVYEEMVDSIEDRKAQIFFEGLDYMEGLADFDREMLEAREAAARGREFLDQHQKQQEAGAARAEWEKQYAEQHPSPPMSPSDQQWLVARQVAYLNMRQDRQRMIDSWVEQQEEGGPQYEQWASVDTARTRPPSETSSDEHREEDETTTRMEGLQLH